MFIKYWFWRKQPDNVVVPLSVIALLELGPIQWNWSAEDFGQKGVTQCISNLWNFLSHRCVLVIRLDSFKRGLVKLTKEKSVNSCSSHWLHATSNRTRKGASFWAMPPSLACGLPTGIWLLVLNQVDLWTLLMCRLYHIYFTPWGCF